MGGDTINWKKFSTEFTAQNPTTTLAFMNGDPLGDTMNRLGVLGVLRGEFDSYHQGHQEHQGSSTPQPR
jgi:hypothetical protein